MNNLNFKNVFKENKFIIFTIFILILLLITYSYVTLSNFDKNYIQAIGLVIGGLNIFILSYLVIKSYKPEVKPMYLYHTDYNERGKFYEFKLENRELLEHKEALESVYLTLQNNESFKTFGFYKIIFITAVFSGKERAFHKNVLITNNMSFEEYYKKVENYIVTHYGAYGSGNDLGLVTDFIVKVFNVDDYKDKTIYLDQSKENVMLDKKPGLKSISSTTGFQKRSYSTQVEVKNQGLTLEPDMEDKDVYEAMDINNLFDGVETKDKDIGNISNIEIEDSDLSLEEMNKIFKDKTTTYMKDNSKDYKKDKYLIKSLIKNSKCDKPFATMDLETISINNKGEQHPICITSYSSYGEECKIFLINPILFKTDYKQAIINMFKEYFTYIQTKGFPKVVFIHNLGSFDGYFLYKYLLEYDYKNTSCIIDKANEFIEINYRFNLTEKKSMKISFRDSFRVFPIRLDDLCKNFNVPGKTSKYDTRFNDITLFDNPELLNEFIEYAKQDSLALYNALKSAQTIYAEKYQVDISEAYSTSSLSLKIFRSHFLKDKEIPILKHSQDRYIRDSYYGGATDYYKVYGEKLYYYDINSLYPFAMTMTMPHKLEKIIPGSLIN
jgi:hypothetical protein